MWMSVLPQGSNPRSELPSCPAPHSPTILDRQLPLAAGGVCARPSTRFAHAASQDLDDVANLDEHITRSSLVLIVVTSGYLSSQNCRRELTAAVSSHKPIVMLIETDEGKGSVSLARLRAEFEEVESSAVLARSERQAALWLISSFEQAWTNDCDRDNSSLPCKVIEWHREKVFKQLALKCIAASVLAVHSSSEEEASLRDSARSTRTDHSTRIQRIQHVDELRIEGEAPSAHVVDDDSSLRVVQMSRGYRGLSIVADSQSDQPGLHSERFSGKRGESVFEQLSRQVRTSTYMRARPWPSVPACLLRRPALGVPCVSRQRVRARTLVSLTCAPVR